jgi:predicted DNA-binding transcriptional regulator AlpA
MNPYDVVRHWGSVKDAATAIGVTDKAIYQWIQAGQVPKLRQFQIAALMKSKSKARA